MKSDTPSATALLVASSVVRAGAAHGLPPAAIRIAKTALDAEGSWLALARYRPGRWLMALVERAVLPGLAAHHCARKAWLWARLQRTSVVDAPVIWAGIGFDGLGRALVRHAPQAVVIETDHPDTLRRRRAHLGDEAGVRTHALTLPVDIDVLDALCAARPATVVCEGVLMYLPPRDVMRLLRRLAASTVPPRLIFSALEPADGCGAGFRRMPAVARRWLVRHGEPFRWRASPEQVRRCLARAGYTVTARWAGRALGEYMIEAEALPR